jgi:hypothetical protein
MTRKGGTNFYTGECVRQGGLHQASPDLEGRLPKSQRSKGSVPPLKLWKGREIAQTVENAPKCTSE